MTIDLERPLRYRILHLPARRQVWVDFEGAIGVVGSSWSEPFHPVRQVLIRQFRNAEGISLTRVILQLDEAVVVSERGREVLSVVPGAEAGVSRQVDLVVGVDPSQLL